MRGQATEPAQRPAPAGSEIGIGSGHYVEREPPECSSQLTERTALSGSWAAGSRGVVALTFNSAGLVSGAANGAHHHCLNGKIKPASFIKMRIANGRCW